MDITKLTETELKALGYEQVKLLNQAQANLSIIEKELMDRSQKHQEVHGEQNNSN